MPRVLKFWHQWSWVFHIGWAAVIATVYFASFSNSMARNSADIMELQQIHKEEKMNERMAVAENTTQQINSRLSSIEVVQGKIFDRINQIADRK